MATYTGTNANDAFTGTSQSDTFNFTTQVLGQDSADGGANIDTLNLDYSSQTSGYYHSVYSSGGSFSGNIYAGSYYNPSLSFQNMEKLFITLASGDDYLSVDASALAAAGTALTLRGGAGNDTLDINFSALTGGTTFTVANNGTVTSNRGTFTTFETYAQHLGAGTNSVTTGAGNDTLYGGTGATDTLKGGAGNDAIYSTNGKDSVDGGADSDHWYGDYSAATAALTFAYNGSTGAGTLTGGTTLANIEGVDFTGGAGNDTIALTGPARGTIDGGAGTDTDTMTENDAELRGCVEKV